MMTVHKLSAGDGYTYYTREVASGDELRAPDRKLGDYYTLSGNPPGVWGGRGAHLLHVAGEVTEPQMELLYGQGLHPLAGEIDPATGEKFDAKLGQRYKRTTQGDTELSKRIDEAMGDFKRLQKREPDADERRAIRTKIGGQYFRQQHGRNPSSKEELSQFLTRQMKPASNAVAGFDLVFSPPKSVSYLWGVSTDEARQAIEKAQFLAVEDTMGFLEDSATYTRKGRNGVRTEGVEGGLIYTRFRHFDSRTGDPQLHDHVVVSNKVLGQDGRWGALDGSQLYKFNVSASEHYNRRIIERVCELLDVAPTVRQVPGKQPIVEIGGVPMEAIEAASSRRASITADLDALVARFTDEHGYTPNKKQMIALSQQATLATRPDKKKGASLQELTEGWRAKFDRINGVDVGEAALARARSYAASHPDQAARGDLELDVQGIGKAAGQVIEAVQGQRAVWSRHHVEAEARRHLGSLAAARSVPAELIDTVVTEALGGHSLTVTPPTPTPAPISGAFVDVAVYQRPNATLYTSKAVLEAESNLLEAASTHVIPAAAGETFEAVLAAHEGPLDDGQIALARAFATSDKLLVAGIGPAGAGKTTAMSLAVDAVQAAGGRVIAVAPTAVAANLLGQEVGAERMTIDALLASKNEPSATFVPLKPGDVVLLDEAGMVGTPQFAQAVALASEAGAVVRAVGDDRQLAAIGAGGALRLIDREIGAVRLEDVHRFRHEDGTPNTAEAAASLAMREPAATGPDKPWTYYQEAGRVHAGAVELMADEVFAAWQKDTNTGRSSLMLAPSNELVAGLNLKAQTYRIGTGKLDPDHHVQIRDDARVHVGDLIVTRNNDRRLSFSQGRDFVKNNDTWEVAALGQDGSLTARHTRHGATVTLPAHYVHNHVMLGYASTVHRAQGITVDTSHALLTATTDRAGAYVATSRGRYENRVYLGLQENERPADVMETIAANHEPVLTAHGAVEHEREQARSLSHLGQIYRDVYDMAHEERVKNTVRNTLGADAGTIVNSPAFGAVRARMDQAEAAGIDPVVLLRNAHSQRDLGTAADDAAVMAWRMEALTENYRAQLENAGHRPLAEVTEPHLNALRVRASAHLAEVTATPRALVEAEAIEAGVKPYTHRLYGHLNDDELAARITTTSDRLARQLPSDPANETGQLTWQIARLQQEAQLRQDMPAPLHEAETLMRDQPARQEAANSLLERINTELELRTITAAPTPADPHRAVRERTGEWLTPTADLSHPDMPEAWITQLDGYRRTVATEHERVGANLAATPPTWAQALGPVPSRPDRAEEWRVLAAEIQAYRHTYNIPNSETALAPKNHQERFEVQDFTARATALHKHSALTNQPGATETNRQHKADRAEDAARPNIEPTQAEAFVAKMRQKREEAARSHTPTPNEQPVPTPAETTTATPAERTGAAARLAQARANLDHIWQNRKPSSPTSTTEAKQPPTPANEREEEAQRRRQQEQERSTRDIGRGPSL